MKDRLSTRLKGNGYQKAQLSIYEKEKISQTIQPMYQYGTLAKIWDVSRDTIKQAVRYLIKHDRSFKIKHLKGTTIELVPSSEIPKLLESVATMQNRTYLPSNKPKAEGANGLP